MKKKLLDFVIGNPPLSLNYITVQHFTTFEA